MDTVPQVINGTAILLSTPLLLAAHLWPWYPLWAAGIWATYGVGALIPQIQPQLSAMTESPFHAKFHPPLPLCGKQGPSKVSIATIIDTMTVSNTKPTTSPVEVKIPTSTPTLNAASFTSALPLVQASTITPLARSSDPVSVNLRYISTAPSSSSAPQIPEPVLNASPSMRIMSPSNDLGLEPFGFNIKAVDDRPAGLPFDADEYHPLVDTWTLLRLNIKSLVFVLILVVSGLSLVALVLWTLWRRVRAWAWSIVAGPNIVQRIQDALPDDMFLHDLARTVLVARQRFVNMVWGAQNPHLRVLIAGIIMALSMAAAHLLFWPLSIWVANSLHASSAAIPAPVHQSQMTAPTPGLDFLRQSYTTATPLAPTNIVAMVSDLAISILKCFSHIKQCTSSVFQHRLFPNSIHMPLGINTLGATEIQQTIAGWVMGVRNLPILAQHTTTSALRNCTAAALQNSLDTHGGYQAAHHLGATAPICSTIEYVIMNYKASIQTIHPLLAVLNHTTGPVRHLLGCLPLVSMVSGVACPLHAHSLNRVIVVSLLTAVFALGAFTLAQWPAPQTRSPNVLAKCVAVFVGLCVLPPVALVMFLCTTRMCSGLETSVMVGTFALVWGIRKSAVRG